MGPRLSSWSCLLRTDTPRWTTYFSFLKSRRPSQYTYAERLLENGEWCQTGSDVKWGVMSTYLGFPGGASGKKPICQCRKHKRRGFSPWVGKMPLEEGMQPTPVLLPGESYRQRSLVGTKSRTWLSRHTHTSPLTGEWRDKLGCVQYNKTPLSKNRELSGPATWMNPKLITLSIIRS